MTAIAASTKGGPSRRISSTGVVPVLLAILLLGSSAAAAAASSTSPATSTSSPSSSAPTSSSLFDASTPTQPIPKEDASNTKKKNGGLFQRFRRKRRKDPSSNDDKDSDSNSNADKDVSTGAEPLPSSTANETVASPTSTAPNEQNSTQPVGIFSQQPQSIPQQQQQQPTRTVYMIPRSSALGLSSGPHGHPSGLGGILSPGMMPSDMGGSSGGRSDSISSLLIPLLSKLLLATLLTPGGLRRHPLWNFFFPRRERAYLPEAVQKYTFERINDRYIRDGDALNRALGEPSAREGLTGMGRWWRTTGYRRRVRMARGRAVEVSKRTKAAMAKANNDTASPAAAPQAESDRTVIVVEFCTDPKPQKASSHPSSSAAPSDPVELLRDQIGFLMDRYHDPSVRPLLGSEVEVVLLVESGGGGVQDFGLAADAVRRVRDAHEKVVQGEIDRADRAGVDIDSSDLRWEANHPLPPPMMLTVCVDRVAASGGYMVACQATRGRLFAAPFALLGSIGVYTERVNVHDLLNRVGITGLRLKAGKSKAPIGTIGEVTTTDIDGVEADLKRVHEAFRSLVKDSREGTEGDESTSMPGASATTAAEKIKIDAVMEGEVYLGLHAKDFGLIDRTVTSDEYLAERVRAGDRVLRLRKYDRPHFGGLGLSPFDLFPGGGNPFLGNLKEKMSSLRTADVINFGCATGIFAMILQNDIGARATAKANQRQYPQARFQGI